MKKLLFFLFLGIFIYTPLYANPFMVQMTKAEWTGRSRLSHTPEPPDKSGKSYQPREYEIKIEWRSSGGWYEELDLYRDGSLQEADVPPYDWVRSWDPVFQIWTYTAYFRWWDWVMAGTHSWVSEHCGNPISCSVP